MTTDRPRTTWLQALLTLGLFFGGGAFGIQLSRWVAPDSAFAEFVSFLMLPTGFLLGFVGWAGAALPSALKRVVLRKPTPSDPPPGTPTIPPGSIVFVPICAFVGFVVGGLVALVAGSAGLFAVTGLYAGTGFAFGFLCHWTARTGWLAFPRE